MHTPQVSIIMAAYNHAQYIDKAIDSALAQTWQDFELIVVDDGSTDATGQVVSQFGSPVRYIYQQNHGQGGARNRGIASARGEFICFLDDDDLWEPEYLATVMSVFQRQPEADALYTGFRIIDGEDRLLPQIGGQVVPPHQMYDALVCGGWFPPLVVTVRKACLDQVGPLDEALRGHDDWDLWLRIARGHVFRGVPEALARYRVHAGGLTSNVQHMMDDRMKLIHKHFGPQDGQVATWPADKRRAYAYAYRMGAFEYNMQGKSDEAWRYLDHAVTIWSDIFLRLDTFYELACGNQPRGYRGQAELVEIDRNGAELFTRLDQLFSHAQPDVMSLRSAAYGNVYLALAMLSDQAGRWGAGRRYLRQAMKANPRLLGSPSVVRRYSKLLLGRHAQTLKQALLFSRSGTRAPVR